MSKLCSQIAPTDPEIVRRVGKFLKRSKRFSAFDFECYFGPGDPLFDPRRFSAIRCERDGVAYTREVSAEVENRPVTGAEISKINWVGAAIDPFAWANYVVLFRQGA
jgi:hypothetical protein